MKNRSLVLCMYILVTYIIYIYGNLYKYICIFKYIPSYVNIIFIDVM